MFLVTGTSGYVGSALLAELHRQGEPVRAGYHSRERAEQAAESGRDAVAVDLSQPDTLAPALHRVDAVFLLAATGPGLPQQEQNLINAAKAAGVQRIVKLSVWRAAAPAGRGNPGVLRPGLDVPAPQLLHAELPAADGPLDPGDRLVLAAGL